MWDLENERVKLGVYLGFIKMNTKQKVDITQKMNNCQTVLASGNCFYLDRLQKQNDLSREKWSN